jgi:hypothetical protein
MTRSPRTPSRSARLVGRRQLLFASAACATALGCTAPTASGPVQNAGPAEAGASDTTPVVCLGDGGLPGATYDITKSKFAFGSAPTLDDVGGGFVRWVGSDGALGIWASGAELGVMNAGAPESNLPDWSSDPAASAAHVLAYFESMGVEACQVPGSGATYFGSGTGTADGGLTSFTSNGSTAELERGYSGIRINESIAFAHFESADQTTSESLYWPAIPADVVSAAIAFQATLATQAGLAAYKALLPPDAQGDGQVVIHHSSSGSQGPFAARVTYDVISTVPALKGRGISACLCRRWWAQPAKMARNRSNSSSERRRGSARTGRRHHDQRVWLDLSRPPRKARRSEHQDGSKPVEAPRRVGAVRSSARNRWARHRGFESRGTSAPIVVDRRLDDANETTKGDVEFRLPDP